jgi:hypothetical protein
VKIIALKIEPGAQDRLAVRCQDFEKDFWATFKKNFDFCICIHPDLCYGVYIPVEELVELAAPELEVSCVTGLPARTENVRAVFFCGAELPDSRARSARDSTSFSLIWSRIRLE